MTAFRLKIIAIITMLIDHVSAVFPLTFPLWFRYIGRIAFPVFAYMIAQGSRHTNNIWKYLLRLGIFALVSEIPFDLAFRDEISFIRDTNIFYTLFLGTACIAVYQKLNKKPSASKSNIDPSHERANERTSSSINKLSRVLLAVLLMIPIALLGNLLGTDYGTPGVVYILVFYFTKPENRFTRTIAATGIVFHMYGYPIVRTYMQSGAGGVSASGILRDVAMSVPNYMLGFFLVALVSVLLILLYNGKQGPKVKWAFYAFYPLHLAALAAIKHLTI